MKKFKFKLESVLKIRQTKLEDELRNLSKVAGNINKLKNNIVQNQNEASNSINQFQTSVGQDINYIRIFDSYLKRLSLQNEQLEKQIQEQQEVLAESRERVTEARKDAEVLEIIKNKQYDEYYQTYLIRERSEEEEKNNTLFVSRQKEVQDEEAYSETKSYFEEERAKYTKTDREKTEYDRLQEYIDTYFSKPK